MYAFENIFLFLTGVKCPGINITSIYNSSILVMPNISRTDDIPYGEFVTFTCTIPSDEPTPVIKSQQCVYDFSEHTYKLIGDSLECKSRYCSKKIGVKL